MRPFISLDTTACSKAPDPDDIVGSKHCHHLIDFADLVCCHCGDIFVLVEDTEPRIHGQYAQDGDAA